ncbi:hypothetical protein ANCDUO_02905 [Ancylostoma duodenale]|uniref:CCDC66 domain-containing protein n=1 Tax=Ancylostoma duodenale TaxID=51022 RepID=A0A0C2HB91_9BILA|nr:hypothetical protein ANCDUO_02905 [Ancylostoma duodenale]
MITQATAQGLLNRAERSGKQDDPPWMRPHPQPRSGVRRSQLWRCDDSINQGAGYVATRPESRTRANSLKTFHAAPPVEPILQRRNISNEEQHKLELLQQIEENKRRRELEKQKEREEEEREIRRQVSCKFYGLERYNEKIRQEEEEERRKQRERAKMMERHSEEVRASNERRARRNSSPPKERKDSVSPSEEPRLEWWEKKPTWQQKLTTMILLLPSSDISQLVRELLVHLNAVNRVTRGKTHRVVRKDALHRDPHEGRVYKHRRDKKELRNRSGNGVTL